MPNWCENTVEIWGDEEDMKEFYDFFGGQDKLQENFSFEMISPMPQELDGTRSPQKIQSRVCKQCHYCTRNNSFTYRNVYS